MRWWSLVILLAASSSCGLALAPQWPTKDVATAESGKLKRLIGGNKAANMVELKRYYLKWSASRGRMFATAADQTRRFQTWRANMKQIVEINERAGETGWWAAPNDATDQTWEEFAAEHLGSTPPASAMEEAKKDAAAAARPEGNRRLLQQQTGPAPPPSVDWVAQGMVSPIHKQSGCGACWAFSAVSALESKARIVLKRNWNLSVQQVIDCAGADAGYQSRGCEGGWPTDAFYYIQRFNLTTEGRYPFRGQTNACRRPKVLTKAATARYPGRIATKPGYSTVTGLGPVPLMQAVAEAPVVVAFNVDSSFQHYAGGIYSASSCNTQTVNHAVVVVGYDVGAGPGSDSAYWLIKNSWGAKWGEKGFARVQMTDDKLGACAMYFYRYKPSI